MTGRNIAFFEVFLGKVAGILWLCLNHMILLILEAVIVLGKEDSGDGIHPA